MIYNAVGRARNHLCTAGSKNRFSLCSSTIRDSACRCEISRVSALRVTAVSARPSWYVYDGVRLMCQRGRSVLPTQYTSSQYHTSTKNGNFFSTLLTRVVFHRAVLRLCTLRPKSFRSRYFGSMTGDSRPDWDGEEDHGPSRDHRLCVLWRRLTRTPAVRMDTTTTGSIKASAPMATMSSEPRQWSGAERGREQCAFLKTLRRNNTSPVAVSNDAPSHTAPRQFTERLPSCWHGQLL